MFIRSRMLDRGLSRRGGAAGVVLPPPPQSPALWFDMADPASMARTGDLIDSITDKIGGVVATAAGAARPTFFADARASGGPRARTRFAGAQSLSIPATVSINRQACSIFVVTRTAVKPAVGSGDRAAFLIASETAVRTALYQWDGAELYTWDSTATATPTGIIAAHGTSVQWLTAGAANVQVGSGPAIWTRGTPLAANISTGGRIGLWTGTSFPLTGDIMGVLVFNRQLNATERSEVLTWCRTRYGSPPVSVATLVGYSGDSITEGIQNQNPQITPDHSRDYSYPAQIEQLAGGSFRYMNCGIGSAALTNNASGAQLALLTSRMNGWPGVTRRVVWGLWGTNDTGGNRTGAQMRADLDTWIAGVRAGISGVFVGHGTILPRSGLSGSQATARADFNDYVMARGAYAGAGAALDFRIDTAAISGLTDPANLAKFVDGLHPTRSGYADLAAGIWNGGLSAQIV